MATDTGHRWRHVEHLSLESRDGVPSGQPQRPYVYISQEDLMQVPEDKPLDALRTVLKIVWISCVRRNAVFLLNPDAAWQPAWRVSAHTIHTCGVSASF